MKFQLRRLAHEVDSRLGTAKPPVLLSVSQSRGVVPRSEVSDGEPRADSFEKYKVVRRDDIVLNRFNAYRGSLGRTDRLGIVSPDYLVLRPTLLGDSAYIAYLLSSTQLGHAMKSSMGGLGAADPDSSGFSRIDTRALARCEVPELSVQEQHKVAEYLDRETGQIDELIAKQEQLIATLAERRQAVITQAATRGLDPTVELEDSGIRWIGKVPKAWTLPKLGWHAKVGNGSTPSRASLSYWECGDVPWLNSSVVNMREVSDATQYVTTQAVRECHLPFVKSGSLLVGLTGQGKTRGAVTMLAFPSTINQHLAYITFRGQLETKFIYWVLKAAYGHLRFISDGNGGTKGGLTCEELRQFRIPMPSRPEQVSIANYLDLATSRLDSLSASAAQMIAVLRERRQALISAAVTGKIDVRGRT